MWGMERWLLRIPIVPIATVAVLVLMRYGNERATLTVLWVLLGVVALAGGAQTDRLNRLLDEQEARARGDVPPETLVDVTPQRSGRRSLGHNSDTAD